eukprot:TRINITY_DN9359_c0_g1_i1.p1 TRINITY_DN9359_c0_g1~~TRINITY_DN9359_c0_g1_i1.p1  ORF type:complete len:183 (-),score=32.95 TRINITY_DN9359_c0_g1_i1:145-693(-)
MIKIALMGESHTGKSAMVIQLVSKVYLEKYMPTIEDSYLFTIHVDDQPHLTEILDTSGSEQFSAITKLYLNRSHGIILMYRIDNESTFQELGPLLDTIEEQENSPTIMIVGNMCDLEHDRVVSKDQAETLAKKYGALYMECSAKERVNVDEVFQELVKEVVATIGPLGSKPLDDKWWKCPMV